MSAALTCLDPSKTETELICRFSVLVRRAVNPSTHSTLRLTMNTSVSVELAAIPRNYQKTVATAAKTVKMRN